MFSLNSQTECLKITSRLQCRCIRIFMNVHVSSFFILNPRFHFSLSILFQDHPCPPCSSGLPCPFPCPVSDLRLPNSVRNLPPLSLSPHRLGSVLEPPQHVSYPSLCTTPPFSQSCLFLFHVLVCMCMMSALKKEINKGSV